MAEDRELLELAAKAAGLDVFWWPADDPVALRLKRNNDLWSPLKDSGDALELAVRLKMAVYPPEADGDGATVHAPGDGPWVTEDDAADPLAATRRAIVRAAAEIGRSMK